MSALARQVHRGLLCVGALALVLGLSACTTGEDSIVYVDSTLPEVTADMAVTTTVPKPVQVVFEFRVNGEVRREFADIWGKAFVESTVKGSGLFSAVSDKPVPGGAVLKIVIDNIALDNDKSVKDFLKRSSAGIYGDVVVNGYVCTAEYVAESNAPKISKEVREILYATEPGKPAPAKRSEKMPNLDMAVTVVFRRLVANAVNDIAKDPEFAK